MVYIKTVWLILILPDTLIKEEIKLRKRLKELRKRDPFIYK